VSGLRISASLTLPLEAITETIAVLGIRGSGKTNTCVVLTEELLDAGQQVVVIDPTDVWHGLRSSKDGKRAGYPVVVFGGRHGDVPLSAGDGATIADFVVEERVPAILSLRHFESQADQRRFVTDFARRLYHRKGEDTYDTPMLLAIDEAHLFVPQRVGGAEAQMVGAIQKLVRQGRSSGIGVALIDQRAASVNKDVLTQLELLICHRTSSPQDRKALEAWIEQHDTADQKGVFLKRLPELARGVAWCWSPGWLDIFKEVPIRERRTFDTSATPKAGEIRVTPTTLAKVDLDALKRRMAAAIDKAKADDPKALRARIAELEQVAKHRAQQTAQTATATLPTIEVRRVEVPILTDKDMRELERLIEAITKSRGEVEEWITHAAHRLAADAQTATRYLDVIRERVLFFRNVARPEAITESKKRELGAKRIERPLRTPTKEHASHTNGEVKLGGGERKCAIAIAQHPRGVTRNQLTQLTGYKRSTRDAYVQRLAQANLVTVVGLMLVVTDEGTAWLGSDYEPLPIGDALREHWMNQLPEGEAKVLAAACRQYPESIPRDALGEAAGYHKVSTRNAYVQRLLQRRLLEETERGHVRAVETLFS